MPASTNRQRAIAKALTLLLPMAPYSDIEKILELASARKMRELPPSIAVWIATISFVWGYNSILSTKFRITLSIRRFLVLSKQPAWNTKTIKLVKNYRTRCLCLNLIVG